MKIHLTDPFTYSQETAALMPAPLDDTFNWDKNIPRTLLKLKEAIRAHLLSAQNHKCIYCNLPFSIFHESHIDHFVPKSHRREFTFEAFNLVLACPPCNKYRKRQQGTLSIYDQAYRRCQFSIVHPIFEDPSAHIKYVLSKSEIIAVGNDDLGKNTVIVLDLNCEELIDYRAKEALQSAFSDTEINAKLGLIYPTL